ncbi:HAD-IA family hydrolase [Paenibacillus sp. BK720]|uniref:HAD family hydrolase n=1 Tax=Paenibacillus sp. BK720 TaxID=2587092 RepID=UPI00142012BC|nr:HAD-IA family hydrolase [Paenibacillus sp. BK720]NIK68114.1 putative hydrolase of the HAD superfamily [Paenibacillus sp. BK720]
MNGEQANSNEAKELIIFLDCGDTIIDEGTEVRDEHGVVIEGKVIPGADEMVRTLAERGYRLAIVADGLAQSFKNLLSINGLYDYFEVLIYSEQMKAEKPDPRMFRAAMGAMLLDERDRERIVMVGNNLSRDVRGANAAGITSVHLNWTSRYPNSSPDPAERPDYTIEEPLALVELADLLNEELVLKKRVQA